ncbi:MAG: phenylalanine--tRNA ligase subunit beta [Acutalibacteraceae bacterium]|nr:phenylalanine--tRNA ligase subunit beta [Acutalibacteraceae bacterium]
MKIALNTLKYYVDINVSVEELCDKMVMAGFEVESIENLADKMSNVVAAKIVSIAPHENSDHLQICQMDTGKGELVQIVTGAQNVFEGALVPAALHDSYLPDGTHITKGKLRGVESHGMLCSGGELELTEADYVGASVNGILILKDEYAPGTDMRDILGLKDYVIDFKITANRPDCNCIIGVAKEVSVVLGTPFKIPATDYTTIGQDINDFIKIDVENYELCPRYVGRVVKNLRIKESPDWMKQVLKTCGMRPINNIVDITNFVMLETGQPMHAFNYNDLADKHIIVRNAKDGEFIQTLDEKKHNLTPDMLVIADGQKPSCLAGIMGGLESEITDTTTDLFLESAKFKRDNIRRTGRALGIRTESSGRFEKGIDVNNTGFAMDRALNLINALDAGDIIDGVIDKYESLPENKILTCTTDSINALLGLNIEKEEMVRILSDLGLETKLDGNVLTVSVPSIRDDIEGRADLAEEIMRIYGYDHIVSTAMTGNVRRGRKNAERIKSDLIKSAMISLGANEIATYSFISSKALDTLGLNEDDSRRQTVKLLNPLGDEYSTMRTQLITSMLTVLSTNYNRKNSDVRFFEISKRFIPKALPLTDAPDEIPTMCIGMYGNDEDFFTLKGVVEEVLSVFGQTGKFVKSSEVFLHPGRQAEVYIGEEKFAVLGEVHPDVLHKYDMGTRAYVAEIYIDKLFAVIPEKTLYKPLPKFPAVTRDLALLCDKDIPVGDLQDIIKEAAGKLCENVELFDVYEGNQIPEGKKSVAFSVTLRSLEATLTDEQIDAAVKRVIKKLDAKGASLRM